MALDYGGIVHEDDRPRTLAEAVAVLEKGLKKWFEEQGIEVERQAPRRSRRLVSRYLRRIT
jgi:hypothetical protein